MCGALAVAAAGTFALRRAAPENDYFQLSANGGVPRERVLEFLRTPKLVTRAVRSGRCFMCRHPEIDAAALCTVCRTFLSDDEREAARVYYDATP